MSEDHPYAEGNLLIEMIGTWLTYQHPDEMDSEDIAKAADLLRRAGLTKYEVDAFFTVCLPPHYLDHNEIKAQHRVAIARFAELRRAFE